MPLLKVCGLEKLYLVKIKSLMQAFKMLSELKLNR